MKLVESDLVPYSAVREMTRGTALVFAPHPDDEVLGCAGAILRHRAADDRVFVIIATDGGHPGEPDRLKYVADRRAESHRAAQVLGIEAPEFWDLHDRSLDYSEELVERIAARIRETEARVVYAPSVDEVHPDHNALGLCVIEAVRRSEQEIHVALFEVSSPLARPNLFLDITDLVARKREAIACFPSQLRIQRYDEQIAGLNKYRTYTLGPGVEAAEAYRVLSRRELLADPLCAFQQPAAALECRTRRGAQSDALVSIVVRTCGRETLGEALASVASQTYPNIEVVIVAANGAPPSRATLPGCRRFPTRVVGVGQGRLSRSRAANLGIDSARGEFVAFLDDDDWLYPDHVFRLRNALRDNRYARAAYGGIEAVGVSAGGTKQMISVFNEAWDPTRLLCENYIPIHAVLFERSLATTDGSRFDESLSHCEDWDFWLQLSRQTPFVHVAQILGAYRQPGGSALYDGQSPASVDSSKQVFSKWSKLWTNDQIARVWDAAKLEFSPGHRRHHEAQLRAELDRTRDALAREQELVSCAKANQAEAVRLLEAEVQVLRSELGRLSSSTAVRSARWVESMSPKLQRKLARIGRAALDTMDRVQQRRRG